MRIALEGDAWIDHEPAWIAADEAEVLRGRLVQELRWERRAIVLFGRRVWQPRLVAWGGERPYRYSGQTLEPRPLGPTVGGLLERVRVRTGVPFDHVLANRYRDGRDSMGLHADDEPELGPDPVVATVSFGATRRLALVPRRPSGEKRALELASGSLLVMGGACQRLYRHAVPRQPRVAGERISLTFRRVLTPP